MSPMPGIRLVPIGRCYLAGKEAVANINFDGLVKSRLPGENRGPEVSQVAGDAGFRLSPDDEKGRFPTFYGGINFEGAHIDEQPDPC